MGRIASGETMLKRNPKPRLHKKMSKRQKIDDQLLYYSPYLIFIIFILVCIIFVILMVMFASGNDFAVVYNWGL